MKAEMREKIVKMVIKESFCEIVGGEENSLADGQIEKMPSIEDLKQWVYDSVMKADNVWTKMGKMSVKKDVRFLGTERIKELIQERFNRDYE